MFVFVGVGGAWEPNEKGYQGVPRPFLWSPVVNKMVDTTKYKKKPPYTIGFCNTSISNIWRVALLHEIQYYASHHKDLIKKLIITDANDDPTKQIADMQSLIQRGVDILLVSAGQSAAMDPIVTRAMKKGIPVVMVDRRVTSDNFVSFVFASDLTIGRWMAQWVSETLNFKGNVTLLAGMAGASPCRRAHPWSQRSLQCSTPILRYWMFNTPTGPLPKARRLRLHGYRNMEKRSMQSRPFTDCRDGVP